MEKEDGETQATGFNAGLAAAVDECDKCPKNSVTELCGICKETQAKYRCPACKIRTCSLKCVKQHKEQHSCSGVRDKTSYVAVKEFTDINLLSDYRFLEDASREADNAQRDRQWKSNKRPYFINRLEQTAKKDGIDLKLMPYPMTKRMTNKLRIMDMNRKNAWIQWEVEWVFPQSDTTFKSLVPGEQTLQAALMVHLHPTESDSVCRHILRRYVARGMDDIHIFMKREGVPANQIIYDELDNNKSLTANLAGKTVIEYPTLHVVLTDFCQPYRVPTIRRTARQTGNGKTCVEDGGSSDSDVSDTSDSSEDSSDSESTEEEEEVGQTKIGLAGDTEKSNLPV